MIKKCYNRKGQTALIMILLAAAALIFFAITLNWGRIAQTKTLVTMAADQGAAILTSEMGSYGEMEKLTYLNDKNAQSGLSQVLIDIIEVIVVIVMLIITILCYGTCSGFTGTLTALIFAALAVVAAVVSLVLQLAIVEPGITKMWNKLQQNQPVQQQFYEQGITTALQGGVTDQATLTDYFDLNANGVFGLNSTGQPADTVGRFAFYYTERLKMLNQPMIPQVAFFYNQLGEFINGETCQENYNDYVSSGGSIALNPSCASLNCGQGPSNPACQAKIANGFQLNDSCTDSNPNVSGSNVSGYNPYCDPCCVPPTTTNTQTNPFFNPSVTGSNQYLPLRPSSCSSNNAAVIAQCQVNNPFDKSSSFNCYNSALNNPPNYTPTDTCCPTAPGANPGEDSCASQFYYLYDPSYQNYADGLSFLAKLGRDESMPNQASSPYFTYLDPTGPLPKDFPNGFFPFFWLMSTNKEYGSSPQVDTIDPTNSDFSAAQYHWCAATNAASNTTNTPAIPASIPAPMGFADLNQLVLPDGCNGKDCCVNFLADTVAPACSPTTTYTTCGEQMSTCSSCQGEPAPAQCLPSKPCGEDCTNATYCDENTPAPTDPATQCNTKNCDIVCTPPEGIVVSGAKCPDGTGPADEKGSAGTPTPDANGKLASNLCTGTLACTPGTNTAPNPTNGGCYCEEGPTPGTTSSTGSCCGSCYSPGIPALICTTETDNCDCNAQPIPTDISAYTIDTVADPSITVNPSQSTAFSYSEPPQTSSEGWIPGDDQFCYSNYPYNYTTAGEPDGVCEWTGGAPPGPPSTPPPNPPPTPPATLDSLDDVMHILSDFVDFSNAFLQQDVAELSSTFGSWYPQAATWIAPACGTDSVFGANSLTCNNGENGQLLNIYNPNVSPTYDLLAEWDKVLTTWMNADYTAAGSNGMAPWCLPAQNDPSLFINGNPNTPNAEGAYISNPANNGGSDKWGDVGHVLACLNWNSYQAATATYTPPTGAPTSTTVGAATTFQNCLNALTPGACPTDIPPACEPANLGRSLLSPKPDTTSGWPGEPYPGYAGGTGGVGVNGLGINTPCDPTATGSFAKWVNDSLTLANSQAPKFALRSAYLTDVYTRAKTIQTAIEGPDGADAAIANFLAPCSGTDCSQGGPAAQLMYARATGGTVAGLPNSVVYGWQDTLPTGVSGGCTDTNGNQVGCSHIVKVTAFSAGRIGSNAWFNPLLPWIQTTSGIFTRVYKLQERDGYVYVSVRRWDQDHSSAITFPNGHALWKYLFHNPKTNSNTLGTGLPQSCIGVSASLGGASGSIGFGLTAATIAALQNEGNNLLQSDAANFQQAFMLNDNGTGTVDDEAKLNPSTYNTCLTAVNTLLGCGTESHACAVYYADNTPNTSLANSGSSGNESDDYKLYFVSCPAIPTDDLPPNTTYSCQE